MIHRSRLLWLTAAASGLISISFPALAHSPECRTVGMRPETPLVTSPETATAIFLAVEDDFFPQADKAGYPDVVAVDEGECGWYFDTGRLKAILRMAL
ncbi:hypothetical protein [Brevundimonas sp. R86498]|uniref:hypothetical protein n=1 Tax=Brevundimonas sp. R86498 TaxID=3093845 RepID=UPI0037C78D0D